MSLIIKLSLLILLSNSVFSQTGEKRIALVIGNKNYQHGGSLTYPLQDAKKIKDALESLNFKVIYRLDASQNTMNAAFLDFIREANYANISLIYYSGHGIQIDGVNHIIPVNANINDKHSAKNLTVNVNDWISQLEANETSVKIIILDACRNNPFKAFTKSYEKGLKQITTPSGSLISFATLADNVAQDNGLFANALAIELCKPQRLIDVFINTRNMIEAETKGQQSPMEWTRLKSAVYLKKLSENSYEYLIDSRDGHRYKTISIGNQTWMAENLVFKPSTGNYWIYENNQNNFTKSGYLYDWQTAQSVCPSGWKLPSYDDFQTLIENVTGLESKAPSFQERDDYNKQRRRSAFNELILGGESGFSVVFGGMYKRGFSKVGYFTGKPYASFASSSVPTTTKTYTSPFVYSLHFRYEINASWTPHAIIENTCVREDGFSVRCLKE